MLLLFYLLFSKISAEIGIKVRKDDSNDILFSRNQLINLILFVRNFYLY